MSDPAASNVVPISADQGPPSTDFEREAVDVLLSNIRTVRSVAGCEPTTVVLVVLADREDGGLSSKVGWFNEGAMMPLRLAYAAARLSAQAAGLGPD